MKKVLFIALAAIMMAACSSTTPEQKAIEENLKNALKSPESYKMISFEKVADVTLKEEIADRLEWMRESAERSKMLISGDGYDWELEAYRKDSSIVAYLESIDNDKTEHYNDVVNVDYKLVYEAKNPMGVDLRSTCMARFDAAGTLVAIQYADGESWKNIGHYYSIPGFNEMIEAE